MKLTLLTILIIITSCSQAKKQKDGAMKEDLTNAVIIDVRTKVEYDQDHIENALHIPYEIIAEKIEAAVPDKSKRILLHCASGGRSGVALRTITEMGYTNATNEGGLADIRRKLKK